MPSMQNYCCRRCFVSQKRSENDEDTSGFVTHAKSILSMTVEDFIRQATSGIITLLTHPPKSTSPFLQLANATKNGLLKVTNLLNRDQATFSALRNQQQHSTNAVARLSLSLTLYQH